jgi:hypothetical protein
MLPQELYDIQADPHETRNLIHSPEHRAVLRRMAKALHNWIDESKDQGRALEPADLAERKGVTKTGTPPNTGYALEESPNSKLPQSDRELRQSPKKTQ